MSEFKHFSAKIYKTLNDFSPKIGEAYKIAWNPINYAIIGGIGVLINYVVQFLLLSFMDWYFTNAIAIILAWVWNWQNATGKFAYLWGFAAEPKAKES